jgi:hypothetical protein
MPGTKTYVSSQRTSTWINSACYRARYEIQAYPYFVQNVCGGQENKRYACYRARYEIQAYPYFVQNICGGQENKRAADMPATGHAMKFRHIHTSFRMTVEDKKTKERQINKMS